MYTHAFYAGLNKHIEENHRYPIKTKVIIVWPIDVMLHLYRLSSIISIGASPLLVLGVVLI